MSNCKSLSIATKKHLWEYYVKLSDFEAQCMFCEIKLCYMNDTNFRKHIRSNHRKIWKYEEEKKLIKWPWMCFKYLNELYSQCIICGDTNILSTTESVKNHLSSHSIQQWENYIYRNWPWKYCIKKDDFVVECNVCHKNLYLNIHKHLDYHMKRTHLDKLKKTHNTVGSSKHVSSLEADTTTSRSLNIATKKHLWEYYVKLSDFKAQCMFCEIKLCYIKDTNFRGHIRNNHREIWKYEEEKKLIKWPWMCFKYLNELYSQCIICGDANILSTTESVKNHLSSHSTQQWKNYRYRGWSWKYYIKKDDCVVECIICHNNVPLAIHKNLDYHIKVKHLDKLKNTQETHNTVGSSKRVSSLEVDTTSRSINIATTKHLWKYYVKLPDFKAQCMFCENKYEYISITHFQTHVAEQHNIIWIYEEERKKRRWPWMYFKYLNESYSQCIICDANVVSLSGVVESHSSSHSKQQRKNYIYRNWAWKYCTRRDDFIVKCNICHNNSSLTINKRLDSHIKMTHSDKLKNTQETHDTVDSSERVSSTDTTSKQILSLKDCYVLLTKNHPYDFYI